MVHKAILVSLALAVTAMAHSSVLLVAGDVSGKMTALGINPAQKQVDPNKDVIEQDANTMPSTRDQKANGFGTLDGKAKVTLNMLATAVKNGGGTDIPKVSQTLNVTYKQIVIDGRFDVTKGGAALIDTTASGNFENSVAAEILVAPDAIKQATIQGTTVVAKAMPMKIRVPDGLVCTGPQNTCAIRIINGRNEGNQFWGGHAVFALDTSNGTATAGAAPATAGNAAGGMSMIKARFEALEALGQELYKRQVPDEILRRDLELTPNLSPTYEDMLKFEEDWAKGLIAL